MAQEHPSEVTEAEKKALAKASQNPVASLISVPFENNFNGDFGPDNSKQNVLNIKPVVPVKLNDNWNLINRVILPVVSQPGIPGGPNRQNGLGDTVYQGFISPAKTGKWIWGAGPEIQIPTHTDEVLGNENWAAGPAVVMLTMPGRWVMGGGVGRVFGIGKQHVNMKMAYYYNVEKPRFGAQWDLQFSLTFLFPK